MCVFNFKSVVKTSMQILSLVLQNRNSEVKKNTYVIFTSHESLFRTLLFYCNINVLETNIAKRIRAAELNPQLVLQPAISNLKHCSNSVSNWLLN